MIIGEAVKRRASDIHIEPLENKFRVRYRIDGVLHEVPSPPKRLQGSVISRLKIMAGMDIAEKRLPQEGRIKIKLDKKDTQAGENPRKRRNQKTSDSLRTFIFKKRCGKTGKSWW